MFVQQGKVLHHARAAPEQCHAIAVGWLAEIQFGIHVADACAQRRQLMQQPALVLARLNGVLLTREPVDDVDTDAGLPDTGRAAPPRDTTGSSLPTDRECHRAAERSALPCRRRRTARAWA